MDIREQFLSDLNMKLARIIEDQNVLATTISAIVVTLDKYEMTERCTEIVPLERSCEDLLQLYAGTLLTEGKSKGTVKIYIAVLRKFRQEIGMRFVDVKTMDVRIWLAKKHSEVSLRTCENYRAYLSAFYSWLKREQLIDNNPMERVGVVQYTEEIKHSFSEIDIDKMRTCCDDKRTRAMIELLLCSGVRVSELCDLHIKDINFLEKSVFVRNGKGGKQRTTYITDLCIKYLKEYLDTRSDDIPNVFITRQHKPIKPCTVLRILKKLQEKSKVENIHPHRFRRTFATNMAKKGMEVQVIQKLLGHTDINTTMIYITQLDETTKIEYLKYS